MWTWGDIDREFAALDEFRRRVDRVFHELDTRWGAGDRPVGAFPRTNLFDGGNELVLMAEVPGLAQNELLINATRETVSMTGERKVKVPEGYSVHRQERGAVKFSRTFTLPCVIDVDKVSAVVKNGLLTIRMAKAPEAQPRQIAVKAQ